jgi:outer membrane protein OmpA-like peptidoglycan-associated protein
MEINILNIIKDNISSDLINKLANFIDEDASSTQKAIDVVLPSLIGGFANQAASQNGATALHDALHNQKHDGTIFNFLPILLGGGSASQGLIDTGEKINNDLLGNKLNGVADWIASFAGIKTGAASGIMNMLSPLVLGAIGKQVLGSNTGAAGLSNLLGNQIGFIKNFLPAGLKSILGYKNINLDTPSVSQLAISEKKKSEALIAEEEKPLFNQLLPWLIMLVAGLIGLFYLRSCNTAAPSPPALTPIALEPIPAIKVESVKSINLPDGDIKVQMGSFLDKLNTAITNTTLDSTQALTFDNVNFAKSSSDLTDSSKTQLNDLVKVLKAYANVTLRIEGHTDSRGDETKNKQLSQDRAASVKKYLVANGINNDRIVTAGFGSAKPIADNATDEGRAKNRRIEAFVIKK